MDVKFGEGSSAGSRRHGGEGGGGGGDDDFAVGGGVLLGSSHDVLRTEKDDFQRTSARGPLGENPISNRSLLSMGGFGGSPRTRRGHKGSVAESEVSSLMAGDVEVELV